MKAVFALGLVALAAAQPAPTHFGFTSDRTHPRADGVHKNLTLVTRDSSNVAGTNPSTWGVCPTNIATCQGNNSQTGKVIVKAYPLGRFCHYDETASACKCRCNVADTTMLTKKEQNDFPGTLDQATQDKWPECPAELATCSKISTVQGLNGPFHKLNITHTPLEHVCVHNMNDNNCVCKCSHFTS